MNPFEQEGALVGLLMSNSSIVVMNKTNGRKLYWASDTQQWEVYDTNDRVPKWSYKGADLSKAALSLAGFPVFQDKS